MGWSAIWLIAQVVFGLLPQILAAIKEEKQKQTGRDEIVKAVLGKFKDVSDRAEKARADARAKLDSGLSDDDPFLRD